MSATSAAVPPLVTSPDARSASDAKSQPRPIDRDGAAPTTSGQPPATVPAKPALRPKVGQVIDISA